MVLICSKVLKHTVAPLAALKVAQKVLQMVHLHNIDTDVLPYLQNCVIIIVKLTSTITITLWVWFLILLLYLIGKPHAWTGHGSLPFYSENECGSAL